MIERLVDMLRREAATHQELGDDFDDTRGSSAAASALRHWAMAEAFRQVLADIEHLQAQEAE